MILTEISGRGGSCTVEGFPVDVYRRLEKHMGVDELPEEI